MYGNVTYFIHLDVGHLAHLLPEQVLDVLPLGLEGQVVDKHPPIEGGTWSTASAPSRRSVPVSHGFRSANA